MQGLLFSNVKFYELKQMNRMKRSTETLIEIVKVLL